MSRLEHFLRRRNRVVQQDTHLTHLLRAERARSGDAVGAMTDVDTNRDQYVKEIAQAARRDVSLASYS